MKKLGFLVLGLALLFAFAFTTCELEGAKAEIVDAATPVFTDEPVSQSTAPNNTVRLNAAATVSDGGSITYQWYELEPLYDSPVGNLISGETWATFEVTPDEEGISLYYVVVTNTNNSVIGKKTASLTSNIIVIAAEDPASPYKFPIIKQQPASDRKMVGDVEISIQAVAGENDTGELRFQWYSVNGTGNKDGVVVNGATSATSTVTLNAPGEFNFYCVVTSGTWQSYQLFEATTDNYVNSEVDTGIADGYPIANYTKRGAQGGDGKPDPIWVNEKPVFEERVKDGTTPKSITSQTATITVIAELVPNATIQIAPNKKYQYVRGFGGMGMNTFQKDRNQKIKTAEEFEKMFGDGDNQLGLNMLRIMIGNDFETDIYQEFVLNGGDPTDPAAVHDYYQQKDEPMYYEGVKIVNKYGGYVLASPWTPPAAWKPNNSKNGGGHLMRNRYGDYARYLRAYSQHMYDMGAPIYVVSIQNEPNFTAQYDGCEWTDEEMRDFFIEQGHFTTIPEAIPGYGGGQETPHVLTMNGETANNPSINNAAMANPVSRAAIDVLGRHTYGDAFFRYAEALDKEPKREVWMTEHNINSGNAAAYPNDSTWNYVWLFLNDLDLSIRQNDESAFIWWYLKRFYCIIGDGTYGTSEGVIYPRGYALSQYAKYAKEMWRCGVNVSGTTADGKTAISPSNCNPATLARTTQHVRVTGFVSKDGNTISLVMYTPTETNGKNGVDMGTVRIKLPDGFIVSKADAMRSTASAKIKKESVMLTNDKNSALVMLPPSTILSVRFTK